MAEDSGMPAPELPAGAASCVHCRKQLPAGEFACPDCTPDAVGGSSDLPPWMRPKPGVGDPDADRLVNSPFVVALALGIMVLFFVYYKPRELRKSRAEPMPIKSKYGGTEAERLKSWSDEMRRDYIDAYGGGPAQGVTMAQLRGLIEEQLRAIERDPTYTKEQCQEIRRIIDRALDDSGLPLK